MSGKACVFESGVAGRRPASASEAQGDFAGPDGLMRCGRCGTPRQMRVRWGGVDAVVSVKCRCEAEADERADEMRRLASRIGAIEASPSHRLCLPVDKACEFGLARDDKRGFRIVREYARRWEQVAEGAHGLVLIGPPGTGKTFAAGCLVNHLRHDGRASLVTSVPRAENVLWDAKGGDRTRVLEGIRSYDLVVIDDLGAERDSPYMDSRAFDLVDACYRSGRPLVVTTNVPLSRLKDPKGLARTRIYDRVLERCQPVIFDGPSYRAARAAENREALRRIIGSDF